MESGTITDGQITASSEWSSTHAPSLARLNRVKEGNKAGSWAAKTNDVNQWLQVELVEILFYFILFTCLGWFETQLQL